MKASALDPDNMLTRLRAANCLERMARSRDASIAQVALAWILAKPWVTSILVGASRLEQLEDNIGALELKLSAEEVAELDGLTKQKARYPNLRWLPDNTDAETMRGAVGKAKA